jgi:HPt (histidine-containing phosphotransfer) domain-containing protein
MTPVEIATKRREADRAELEAARETGDWTRAFDVLHANFAELEALQIRSLSKHDQTHDQISQLRALMTRMIERVGDLVDAQERAHPPSYRPSRASASNLDAQAIGQTIEGVYTELKSDGAVMASRIEAIAGQMGSIPDATKGHKGSGIAAIVHRLDSKATLAKLMLAVTAAGAAGANVAEFVKWLVHAAKG